MGIVLGERLVPSSRFCSLVPIVEHSGSFRCFSAEVASLIDNILKPVWVRRTHEGLHWTSPVPACRHSCRHYRFNYERRVRGNQIGRCVAGCSVEVIARRWRCTNWRPRDEREINGLDERSRVWTQKMITGKHSIPKNSQWSFAIESGFERRAVFVRQPKILCRLDGRLTTMLRNYRERFLLEIDDYQKFG